MQQVVFRSKRYFSNIITIILKSTMSGFVLLLLLPLLTHESCDTFLKGYYRMLAIVATPYLNAFGHWATQLKMMLYQ
ncbi:hypothetical protein F5Y14DRAFT_434633 [Nemania sp. NC0429]|nr:hypothetical protein F5Y14DRAFT_434633 [Nemania sp. NC0429]